MDITDFCAKHYVCAEGLEWARQTGCKTMAELWARDDMPPDYRVWIAPYVLSDADCRMFAVWCVRQVGHLLTDPRSLDVIDVAERYADGDATDAELAAAREAARGAAGAAAGAAAWAAARGAAGAAARAAAWEAAWAAAGAAARGAAGAAARAAAEGAQAKYLIDTHSNLFASPGGNGAH